MGSSIRFHWFLCDFCINESILINAAGFQGNTALHLACEYGRTEIVKSLLALKDIDMNKPNERGETPFNIVCKEGYYDIISLFLSTQDIIKH